MMALPTLGPVPWRILSTPGGNPASLHICPSKEAVSGVISDGFAMTQLPAAMAGAIFQVKRYKGRFQGEIHPTMPIGCRSV